MSELTFKYTKLIRFGENLILVEFKFAHIFAYIYIFALAVLINPSHL